MHNRNNFLNYICNIIYKHIYIYLHTYNINIHNKQNRYNFLLIHSCIRDQQLLYQDVTIYKTSSGTNTHQVPSLVIN